MTFILEDKHKIILNKYHEMWNKVENLNKKYFNTENMYNNKYLMDKLKSYDKVIKTTTRKVFMHGLCNNIF